jgi:hypothetical protein
MSPVLLSLLLAPAGLPGFNSPGEAAMFELQAVQAAVAAVPAAHSLALCCLQSFTLLLGCGKELPLQLLQATLAALALQPVQPAAAEAPNKAQVRGSPPGCQWAVSGWSVVSLVLYGGQGDSRDIDLFAELTKANSLLVSTVCACSSSVVCLLEPGCSFYTAVHSKS